MRHHIVKRTYKQNVQFCGEQSVLRLDSTPFRIVDIKCLAILLATLLQGGKRTKHSFRAAPRLN